MKGKELYLPRILESSLKEALADTPVVCLLGPRQCGKTTLAQSFDSERAFVSLDEDNYYQVASMDPAGFIASLPDVVTLDEVQRVPELLPAIKLSVDRDRRPGRFLLTGSANILLLPRVTESLAGRMEVIQLQPLTEAEKEYSGGSFLRSFLEGRVRPGIHDGEGNTGMSLPNRLVSGGYPEALSRLPTRSRQWHRQYMKSMIERDVRDISRVKDGDELGRLIELLAWRSGQLINISSLSKELGLHRETVEQYISILERLFLIRRLPAWHRNSAKRLIKAPKIHLIDSGLAATLTGLESGDWNEKRASMGHLLESFVVQQLLAQAGWTDADLRFWHYRDKDQVEVDLVITRGAQTWGIEVKAAVSLSNRDGKGLARLAEQCGKDFRGGIVLYAGQDTLPLGNTPFLAVPLHKLWSE